MLPESLGGTTSVLIDFKFSIAFIYHHGSQIMIFGNIAPFIMFVTVSTDISRAITGVYLGAIFHFLLVKIFYNFLSVLTIYLSTLRSVCIEYRRIVNAIYKETDPLK